MATRVGREFRAVDIEFLVTGPEFLRDEGSTLQNGWPELVPRELRTERSGAVIPLEVVSVGPPAGERLCATPTAALGAKGQAEAAKLGE